MTGAPPDVSIVVVAWRARADVLRCLAAIAEHAGVDYEVIVVDDGSGDGTAEAVTAQFPAARLIAKPVNEGLVAGRNSALLLVRGRFVCMLDADTELRRGALAAMVATLDADPAIGLVGPRLLSPDGGLQFSCRRWPPFFEPLLRRGPYARWVDDDPPSHRRHLMKDFDHAHRRPVVWVAGAAQMWRAELRDSLGTYDLRVSSYGGEDLDWCLRVWAAGFEVHYVPEAEILHDFQQLTRRSLYGRRSWRALRDWYYLQIKHRRLRGAPRLEKAVV
jgi:GT2 family glycosyltransferase